MIDAQEMQFEAEPRQLMQFESHSDVSRITFTCKVGIIETFKTFLTV